MRVLNKDVNILTMETILFRLLPSLAGKTIILKINFPLSAQILHFYESNKLWIFQFLVNPPSEILVPTPSLYLLDPILETWNNIWSVVTCYIGRNFILVKIRRNKPSLRFITLMATLLLSLSQKFTEHLKVSLLL